MKKLIIIIVSLFICSVGYSSSFETLTVGSSTAIGFTASKLTERPIQSIFITIESQDVRILYGTSTSPTSSVGLYFPKSSSFRLDNQRHMETFKVISTSGTATVSCLFEP